MTEPRHGLAEKAAANALLAVLARGAMLLVASALIPGVVTIIYLWSDVRVLNNARADTTDRVIKLEKGGETGSEQTTLLRVQLGSMISKLEAQAKQLDRIEAQLDNRLRAAPK